MKLSKKIINTINTIKNFFIIIGAPAILYFAYQIHTEQLNNKNIQIELLESRIENLKDGQINEVWDKYKSLKEFTEFERKELKSKLEKQEILTDSLKKYISGAIVYDKNRIILTKEQARKIIIDLVEGDLNKKKVNIFNKIEANKDQIIKNQEAIINNLKINLKENEKFIEKQNKVINMQDKIIKSK